jgi:hypothetical protein
MRCLLTSILVFAIQSLASLALANEPPVAIATTNKMTTTGGDGNTVTLTGTDGPPPVQTGWIDWDADTNTTALTLGGNWIYLLSTSVNQQVGRDGNVTGASLWIHNATNLIGIGFVVCRPTGTANQYTVIGKSEEITTGYATGANTFYFTNPIEGVLSTDIFTICVKQSIEAQCLDGRITASEFDCNDVGTGVIKWLDTGNTTYSDIDVNDNFTTTGGGTTWLVMPMCPLMEPPTVIGIGDSIAEGSTLNFSYRTNYAFSKDRFGSYQQVTYRDYGWTYENGVGTSSARSANSAADLNQNAKEHLGIFDKRPQYIHCHVGINDINDGVTWDDYLVNITTILRHCEKHNAKLILDALFPITGKADNTTGTWAHNTTRDTWNAKLAAWAATEPNVIFLNINDTLGQKRTVNKTGDTNALPADNLWDLIPGYISAVDGLGVHLSQAGCSAASCAMNYALGHYFGVDVGAAYSESIYIKHKDVKGTLVNFPVVIDANCIKNNNFWTQVRSDGGDIWVDYAGSEIPRELVAIDTTAHTIELWFILPSVSSSVDTKATLHWGGDICRGNSTNVWDANTKMVQHCNYVGGSYAPQLVDSTIFNNDLNQSAGYGGNLTPVNLFDRGTRVCNIEYDSVTDKYWWLLQNYTDGNIYLASAPTLTGNWTLESIVIPWFAVNCLRHFGTKWYIYGQDHIYYAEANDVNGPYSAKIGPLLSLGAAGEWDDEGISEPHVFEKNDIYYLFYMGWNGPNDPNPGIEKVGYATSTSPTGPFTKYAGNPVLDGNDGWNSGNVKAAHPYVFQFDSNTNDCYIGYTANASNGASLSLGFESTTDFNTFTELAGNPVLTIACGGGPPIDVNGIWYLPYEYSYGTLAYGRITTPWNLPDMNVSGKIGSGVLFNTTGNFKGKTANLNNATITGATISFWGDFNTLTSGTILSKGSVNTITKIIMGDTYTIYAGIGGNSSTYKTIATIADYRNIWHKFDMRWVNSTDELSFYVDGSLIGSATETSNWPTNSTFSLGAAAILKGIIDEVRISDVDRGADWIYTSYQNQNDPEGFWSGGSNIEDLDIFCDQWLQDVDCFGQLDCPDLIHDDYVDFADYAELVRDWGI